MLMFCSLPFLPGQSPDLLSALSHGTTPSNLYHSHYHILSTGIALPIHMKSTSHWPFLIMPPPSSTLTDTCHSYHSLHHGMGGMGLVSHWSLLDLSISLVLRHLSTDAAPQWTSTPPSSRKLLDIWGHLTLFAYTTMNSNTMQIANGV